MAKLFDSIRVGRPKLNKFDLSHERKMGIEMGQLIPILVQEIVPGDRFRVQSEILCRFAPLLSPMMHRVNVRTEFFFVPNRLVWDEWEDFITGGVDGEAEPVAPFYKTSTTEERFPPGGFPDFMGLPLVPAMAAPLNISVLPFRAAALIWNEYYRDQTLHDPIEFSKASGEMNETEWDKISQHLPRCWEKDYFTSALPFAQRGGEVLMPIEGTGTVTYKNPAIFLQAGGTPPIVAGDLQHDNTGQVYGEGGLTGTFDNIDDVTLVNGSTTINELRRAIKLQEWLEKNARGGARYIEQILSHFGVVSSDARLQRPEYLGGGRTPVVISEVLSTFESDGGDIPQGNMAGHGISVGNQNGFSRRFEEHGFVIGFMSVLPRTAYQQGLNRMFTRFDKLDYYWPEFAHLGEQEVKNKELFVANDAQNEVTFGYQSRYCDYKYKESTVHGSFKDSLNFWHMGRIFAGRPELDAAFVESNPTTRVFAVPAADEHLYVQIYNRIDALRPMPYFGTPSI